MTLNGLQTPKIAKNNLFYFFFYLHNFILFLELFLNEPAKVLRYTSQTLVHK